MKKYNYSYFVNNGEFFFEGQILNRYDYHGNYIEQVQILKFIKHYHRVDKTPYICASIKFLDGYKSHILTFDAEKHLGKTITNKPKDFLFSY